MPLLRTPKRPVGQMERIPALREHVADIVLLGTQEQVGGLPAQPDVAGMADVHTLGDRTLVRQHPGQSMGTGADVSTIGGPEGIDTVSACRFAFRLGCTPCPDQARSFSSEVFLETHGNNFRPLVISRNACFVAELLRGRSIDLKASLTMDTRASILAETRRSRASSLVHGIASSTAIFANSLTKTGRIGLESSATSFTGSIDHGSSSCYWLSYHA